MHSENGDGREATEHTEVRKILHLAQIYPQAALPLPGYPFLASSFYSVYLFSFFSYHLCLQRRFLKQKTIGYALGSLVPDT